MWHYKMLII